MKMIRQNKLLLLLLIVLSLCLTACEDADVDLAIDLAIEWAFEKGLVICKNPSGDPATCEIETTSAFNRYVGGEVVEEVVEQIPGIGGLSELAGDLVKSDDLDEGAKDVLDTAVTAKDVIEADSLAEEGFGEEDPEKIQRAIAIRENDWSYDEKLGVIYLAQGNQAAASDAQNQADEKARQHLAGTLQQEGLSQEDEKAHKACYRTYFTQYTHRENALVIQINKMMDADPPQNADLLIGHLDLVRKQIADLEQSVPGNPCFNYGSGE
jgi:hypothetical protein